MTNKTEHALEHGEHAAHAAHDPFDRLVTITIAITAALLACATMLGHRAHTETLSLQLKSSDAFMKAANDRSRSHTGSTESFMKATNQWNYFQSKKNRQYLYETAEKLATLEASKPGSGVDDQTRKTAVDREIERWRSDAARYKTESAAIETDARKFTNEAEQKGREADQIFQAGAEEAEKYRKEAEHMHHLGNRYDLAELGVEIGLVLCSLAILTKKRNFWYGGMGCSAIGSALMLWGVAEQYILH
jgi:hypothetical protein